MYEIISFSAALGSRLARPIKESGSISISAYASTPINNNGSVPVIPRVSNNCSLYSNPCYGIEFQPPQAWDTIEVLDGPVTLIEYTSPPRNEMGIIELPTQGVISIEKGLNNITTLQQYGVP